MIDIIFGELAMHGFAGGMDGFEELNKMERKKRRLKRHDRISFSATLPGDGSGVFAGSLCVVKLSKDPFSDIRESILEMIDDAGVRDWNTMEELVYCYIALNSPEVHEIIVNAFLSLCYS
ncbi:PREDICTED: transcription repressor OFP1 [Theobroma cacao]|uniref:Transcription repressor n=1 Tax=Theobroma cacao TaxID=3641 RepID=A0AB32VDZ9_THECC|nr:PREDICTED: transcription repressor OFP1 [Theobroma cacao]